jgi:hypothetical protein
MLKFDLRLQENEEFIKKNEFMNDPRTIKCAESLISDFLSSLPSDEFTLNYTDLEIYYSGVKVDVSLDTTDLEWITTQPETAVSLHKYTYYFEKKTRLNHSDYDITLVVQISADMPSEDLLLYKSLGKIKTYTNTHTYESLSCDI